MGKKKYKYCCQELKKEVKHKCDIHLDPWDCPDNLIYHNKKDKEFGLIVHDGGTSYIVIKYCPFCGSKL